MERRALTGDEYAELGRYESERLRLQGEREEVLDEVASLLDRAEEADVGSDGVRALRVELRLERARLAEASGDSGAAEFHLRRAGELDVDGRMADQLHPSHRLTLESDPPGAEVFLFRFRALRDSTEGGRRYVPLPEHGRASLTPGAWALRVARSHAGFRAEDVIYELAGWPIEGSVLVARGAGAVRRLDRLVSIDGAPVRDLWEARERGGAREDGGEREFAFEGEGGPRVVRAASLESLGIELRSPEALAAEGGMSAKVVRSGAVEELELPPGLELRTTGAPLFPNAESSLGSTPLRDVPIENGEHLLLLVHPDFAPLRIPYTSASFEPGSHVSSMAVTLAPEEEAPAGFVRVWPGGVTPSAAGGHQLFCSGARDWTAIAGADVLYCMEREVVCAEYLEFLNDPATRSEIDASEVPLRYPRTKLRSGADPAWRRLADGSFTPAEGWVADHPVTGVSWSDASAFAAWRTSRARREGQTLEFRLPAFALRHDVARMAPSGAKQPLFVFGDAFVARWTKSCFARSYACIEPVRSFPLDESAVGLFDMAGSAAEWCDGWFWEEERQRPLAGQSWGHARASEFVYHTVRGRAEDFVDGTTGFRLVAIRGP